MKQINFYISEKLQLSKKLAASNMKPAKQNQEYKYHPKSRLALKRLINKRATTVRYGEILDLNDIDTSAVDDMSELFKKFNHTNIDISNWDVSNVRTFRAMFANNNFLKSIGDISNWDVSNAVYMSSMFKSCSQLTTIGKLDDWDVSNVITFSGMFESCTQLSDIGDISLWTVSRSKNFSNMFSFCYSLKSIGDISDWNIMKTANIMWMFDYCKKIQDLGDLDKWDISKGHTYSAFDNCEQLKNFPSWYNQKTVFV